MICVYMQGHSIIKSHLQSACVFAVSNTADYEEKCVNYYVDIDKTTHCKLSYPDFVHEYYKTIDLQQGLAIDVPPDVQDDPRTQRVK